MRVFSVILCVATCVTSTAYGATPATGRGRNAQNVVTSARVVMPVATSVNVSYSGSFDTNMPVSGNAPVTDSGANNMPPSDDDGVTPPAVDHREKERAACIGNNIGIGNTFVWASRYSDTSNYSAMREDTANPENNVCFVRVGLSSGDSRVNLSDIAPRYFEMGRTIVCGDWANEADLKKRILDAKKSARTWGVVASSVGGAGLGVGAMELFGNKLIGGKVQGQKALAPRDLFISQLKELKKDSPSEYNDLKRTLKQLEDECGNTDLWGGDRPDNCDASKNMYIGIYNELP